jgi:hypothetical protein
MSEWWTYRPSDLLLFSARTYYRLFELYNAAVWPAQVLSVGIGLVLWLALLQGRAWAPRAACALLALSWFWVAWAFHWQRYASINWAATWFAAAFAVEGLLLVGWAFLGAWRTPAPQGRHRIGLALWLFALVVQPAVGMLLGRPWQQAEVFGLAPDPTVLGSLGLLLLLMPARATARAATPRSPRMAWLLWPIPLLWCAVTGTTLATMYAVDALLMPLAALLALMAAWRPAANRA